MNGFLLRGETAQPLEGAVDVGDGGFEVEDLAEICS